MADEKLSGLTAREANVGDPFNDLLYYFVAAGATNADKQRKTSPFDLLLGATRKMSWFFSDFHNPQSGEFTQGVDGNGASSSSANIAEGNHPGVIALSTGTDSTGGAGIWTTNTFGFITGGGAIRTVHYVKTGGTLSDGTNRYGLYCGLASDYYNHAPTNAILVRYRDDVNGGKWQLVCRNGGSESTQDIGVTVAADTWYRIQIDINADASSVTATVNGTTSAAVISNISTSEMFLQAMMIKKALGSSDREVFVDGCGWMQHFTTAR